MSKWEIGSATNVTPIKAHRAFERVTRASAAGCLRVVRDLKPKEVLIIGTDADGYLFVRGSPPDPANAMWLMELAKHKLTTGQADE